MPPKVSIIFGEPKKKDAFGGKGHELSARALADGIRQIADKPAEDPDGRPYQDLGGAIGLEGAWGSGKSTVIDIAREECLKDSFLVFTFDLWRHQSDDFRRSLLEEFLLYVERLIKAGKLDAGVIDVEAKQNEVRNRTTVTTKTDQRRFTFLGIAFILSLPLLPLIYTWLSPISPLYKMISTWTRDDRIALVLGAAAVTLAVFAAASFWASRKVDKKEKFGSPRWFTAGASRLFNITRQEEVSDETKTIRDEDPTTVEFRRVFEGILKPVQDAGPRVVFVLDNIDRLPAEDVRRVWADLRALNSKGNAEKNASVIAVIPYDRDHVSQAFPPIKVKVQAPRPTIIIVPSDDDAAKAAREFSANDRKSVDEYPVGSDVFEKTFDRIVKVSAPLASDWKAYLLKCMSEAFEPDHNHDTEKLFRLLKYRLELEGVQPTPRRIISYINDIGGLWVQWFDSGISLPTIALYVLHRGDFDRDPDKLSHRDPVNIRFQRIVDDPEYARNLAALAFNVEPAKANQVRLGQPIAMALVNTSGPGDLQALAEADGFNELFPDELRLRLDEWAADSPESISQAAMNVAEAEPPLENQAMIWGIFSDIIGQVQGLTYDLVDDVPGLFKIVEKQAPAGVSAARLRAKFEHVDKDADPKPEAWSSGSGWISVMRQLCAAIEVSEGGAAAAAFWSTTPPSTEPGFIIGAANAWHRAQFQDFAELDLGSDMQTLSKALLEQAAKNPAGYRPAMEVLHRLVDEFAPEHLAEVANLLKAGEPAEGLGPLFGVPQLFLPGHVHEVISALDPVTSTGELAANAWAFNFNNAYADSASALFLSVLSSEGAALPEPRGSDNIEILQWNNLLLLDASGLNTEIVASMAEQVAACGVVSIWIDYSLDRGSSGGLVQAVLIELLKTRVLYIGDAVAISRRFDDLTTMLGSGGVSTLLGHLRSEEIAAQYTDAELTNVPSEMIAALGDLPRNAHARDILGRVSDLLDDLPKAVWEKALSNPSSQELRLLFALNGIGARHIRSDDFVDAVAANAVSVLAGTFDPASMAKDWSVVLDAVHPDSVERLRLTIQDLFHSAVIAPKGPESFVIHFGPIGLKLKFSGGEEMADKALIQFYQKLLNSSSSVAAEYLRASAPEIQRCLKKASKSAKKEYEVAVKAAEALAEDNGKAAD
tara:strand:+ start:2170 stop:5658 length:3489 start_codon:yes stop_codon:yes gene_type:complete